ncbi:NUDIX hydrolase [Gracilimonas sp. Q87]|uniref:NUDIX hydrolase n=1 Tax=Gracilimonas sp. Q87 TaxID=3384766 RepID=UPI0039844EF5
MSNTETEPITAAGGIVYRLDKDQRPEVLMIFRNGVWDLPKGKHEEGETIEMCAAREVSEEVGSKIPSLVKKLGETYHEYPENGKIMGKTTHWYSMIFTQEEDLVPQKEEGIEKIEWMPLNKAVKIAGYNNLKDILKKFMT